jgi:hypothetical protein
MRLPISVFVSVLASCIASGAAEASEPPAQAVRVKNIGMHIGGGPNDARSKAPFQQALAAVFGEFERCHASAERKSGTFGVDLFVPEAGGRAEASAPRTAMGGETFVACMMSAFEKAEFSASKRGATKLSYSLEFSVAE